MDWSPISGSENSRSHETNLLVSWEKRLIGGFKIGGFKVGGFNFRSVFCSSPELDGEGRGELWRISGKVQDCIILYICEHSIWKKIKYPRRPKWGRSFGGLKKHEFWQLKNTTSFTTPDHISFGSMETRDVSVYARSMGTRDVSVMGTRDVSVIGTRGKDPLRNDSDRRTPAAKSKILK